MTLRPSRSELAAAAGRSVDDVIAPGLDVLFCGINPGLYSAAVGHHFARPGNRFWKALFASGLTDRLVAPQDERDLLDFGIGITNLVARASAMAHELGRDELVAGGQALLAKLERYAPQRLAVLGIGAFKVAFGRPRARLGRQAEPLGGVETFVLANPSGAQARYQLEDLAAAFAALRQP
ncbi:MAG: G/U mismatch-specific DNA glycosylase [Actinomycetota bacterium]|nr:G/U mismatch-specific DNA glycosylase [Actinomycetota bacterium]